VAPLRSGPLNRPVPASPSRLATRNPGPWPLAHLLRPARIFSRPDNLRTALGLGLARGPVAATSCAFWIARPRFEGPSGRRSAPSWLTAGRPLDLRPTASNSPLPRLERSGTRKVPFVKLPDQFRPANRARTDPFPHLSSGAGPSNPRFGANQLVTPGNRDRQRPTAHWSPPRFEDLLVSVVNQDQFSCWTCFNVRYVLAARPGSPAAGPFQGHETITLPIRLPERLLAANPSGQEDVSAFVRPQPRQSCWSAPSRVWGEVTRRHHPWPRPDAWFGPRTVPGRACPVGAPGAEIGEYRALDPGLPMAGLRPARRCSLGRGLSSCQDTTPGRTSPVRLYGAHDPRCLSR